MIGILYLITNTTNDLVYVGKTYGTLDNRWKTHIRDSKKYPNRPLYKAISTIGVHNFYIKSLGNYPEGELELKEQDTILELNSYIKGYNDTLGGEGRRRIILPDLVVIEEFNKCKNVSEVSRNLHIDKDTITKILSSYQVDKPKYQYNNKAVRINELDLIFNSCTECAKYLINQSIAKTNNILSVSRGVQRALSGDRKSYLKYTFSPV
jgi:hypothetical protein